MKNDWRRILISLSHICFENERGILTALTTISTIFWKDDKPKKSAIEVDKEDVRVVVVLQQC